MNESEVTWFQNVKNYNNKNKFYFKYLPARANVYPAGFNMFSYTH